MPLAASIGSEDPTHRPDSSQPSPGWMAAVPFFLSAFFFLSGFFALFAALPILFCYLQKGRKLTVLAAITNTVIVALAEGAIGVIFYFVLVLSLSIPLAEALKRKKSIEKAVLLSLGAMILASVVGGLIYSQVHHVNPILEFYDRISHFADLMIQSIPPHSGLFSSTDLAENKHEMLVILPAFMANCALFLVWINLVAVLRMNPCGIREHLGLDAGYLKHWKAPEFLIWPTLFVGFFLVIDFGFVSEIAINVFRFLMAIYAIQGLSILSYFLDLWAVRGFLRWVGFIISVFLMMPLVLCLGFFDLWFDFRSKFRQS